MRLKRRWIRPDPRTRLFILVLCSLLAFTAPVGNLWIIVAMMAFYLWAQGLGKNALLFTLVFLAFYGLQLLIQAHAPSLGLILGFALYYFMRFVPFMMAANSLWAVPPGELIAALQKMRLPKAVVIALAVGLRYMPGMAQEYRSIQEAARLRGVSVSFGGLIKNPRLTLECALVPLLMRSLKIADELAASAASRGIEYPGERSSLRPVRLQFVDGAVLIAMLLTGVIILTSSPEDAMRLEVLTRWMTSSS